MLQSIVLLILLLKIINNNCPRFEPRKTSEFVKYFEDMKPLSETNYVLIFEHDSIGRGRGKASLLKPKSRNLFKRS